MKSPADAVRAIPRLPSVNDEPPVMLSQEERTAEFQRRKFEEATKVTFKVAITFGRMLDDTTRMHIKIEGSNVEQTMRRLHGLPADKPVRLSASVVPGSGIIYLSQDENGFLLRNNLLQVTNAAAMNAEDCPTREESRQMFTTMQWCYTSYGDWFIRVSDEFIKYRDRGGNGLRKRRAKWKTLAGDGHHEQMVTALAQDKQEGRNVSNFDKLFPFSSYPTAVTDRYLWSASPPLAKLIAVRCGKLKEYEHGIVLHTLQSATLYSYQHGKPEAVSTTEVRIQGEDEQALVFNMVQDAMRIEVEREYAEREAEAKRLALFAIAEELYNVHAKTFGMDN